MHAMFYDSIWSRLEILIPFAKETSILDTKIQYPTDWVSLNFQSNDFSEIFYWTLNLASMTFSKCPLHSYSFNAYNF